PELPPQKTIREPIQEFTPEPDSHSESLEPEPELDNSNPSSNGFQPPSSSAEIYGKVHVRRIFTSLFPNNPSLNSQPPKDL
ncbi:hypothetical protein IQ235_12245, partial [Oscillatoriales cyanobacterium LEGE 11467]